MNKTEFDLWSLVPGFSLIFNGGISGGGRGSALFVLCLIIIGVLFSVYALWGG